MSDASPKVSDLDVDLGQLFVSLWRNWLRILLVALAAGALAYLLLGLVTPLYRADTRILIESRESVYTRPASAGIGTAERVPLDDETVASQVEVIGSTDILLGVARELDLASHDEFGEVGETSTLGNLLILLGLKSDPSQDSLDERVLRAMQDRLSIYRVEGSRVIVISFSTQDPALAAAIPNAIADAYIAEQEQATRLSNADATDWLEPEIQELRQRVRQAEARVAEYRAQTGLLLGQNNSVLPTQQLAELSTELTRVSSERAAAEARAQAIGDAMRAGTRVETLPDVMASPIIQRLLERQLQLEADLADLSVTLLDNHPRMKALRAQLGESGRQLRSEVEKVRLAVQNEAASARARESQLASEFNRLKAASAQAGDDEVELRALEREAAAERALLESYLTRYREAAARADRNSMPADARIFARAIPPHQPYFPKKGPLVIAAFAVTILMLSIIILLRELFSGRAMRPAAGAVFSEPVAQVEPEDAASHPVAVAGADVQSEVGPEPELHVAEVAAAPSEVEIYAETVAEAQARSQEEPLAELQGEAASEPLEAVSHVSEATRIEAGFVPSGVARTDPPAKQGETQPEPHRWSVLRETRFSAPFSVEIDTDEINTDEIDTGEIDTDEIDTGNIDTGEPVQPAVESPEKDKVQPESEDHMARPRSRRDELTISDAVARLIAGDAGRAIFISPQGDEASAASVTLAREIADAGLRVVFVDLTWSGAPSTAMLESDSLRGVTDLLAAQARFADVLHEDLYSNCHVMPAGIAGPHQAGEALDRLPMILEALDTAYEILVVECGATDAESVAGIVTDYSQLFVSALDPQNHALNHAVDLLVRDLEAAGFGETWVVMPRQNQRQMEPRGHYAAESVW